MWLRSKTATWESSIKASTVFLLQDTNTDTHMCVCVCVCVCIFILAVVTQWHRIWAVMTIVVMGRLCNHWWVDRVSGKQRGREEAAERVERIEKGREDVTRSTGREN